MLIETSSPKNTFAPIVPPRNQITSTIEALKPSVGTKLEGLLLNSDSDSDFDPRADEQEMNNGSKMSNDLFGFEPSKTSGQQLFNSGSFTDGTTNNFTNHSSPPPLCELSLKLTKLNFMIHLLAFSGTTTQSSNAASQQQHERKAGFIRRRSICAHLETIQCKYRRR